MSRPAFSAPEPEELPSSAMWQDWYLAKTSLVQVRRQERPPLSEIEVQFIETQVPTMAQAATQSAYWKSLTHGRSVVCAQGNELVEIKPDGSRSVLDSIEAGVSLPVGTRISL